MRALRILAAGSLLLVLLPQSGSAGNMLEPLVVGWERLFKLDWQVAERRGRSVISGYLINDSSYPVKSVRLLVDAFDASGAIVRQQLSWGGAGGISPSSRAYFEVPAPPGASKYQVRVFSYDRVEDTIGTGR